MCCRHVGAVILTLAPLATRFIIVPLKPRRCSEKPLKVRKPACGIFVYFFPPLTIYGLIMSSGTKPPHICWFLLFPLLRSRASHGVAHTPCTSFSLTSRAPAGSAPQIARLLSDVLNLFLLVAGQHCSLLTETISCSRQSLLPGFDCRGARLNGTKGGGDSASG